MIKTHNLLATSNSNANNKTFEAGNSITSFTYQMLTPETSNSKLADQLRLAMADTFLTYNLQPILHILYCIKYSQTFHMRKIQQDFYPAPPAESCLMAIKFLDNKASIKVTISRKKTRNKVNQLYYSETKKSKKNAKLIDTIQYLEETYKEL